MLLNCVVSDNYIFFGSIGQGFMILSNEPVLVNHVLAHRSFTSFLAYTIKLENNKVNSNYKNIKPNWNIYLFEVGLIQPVIGLGPVSEVELAC